MVKGVIFDMDGLMFEPLSGWIHVGSLACKELGLPLPADMA